MEMISGNFPGNFLDLRLKEIFKLPLSQNKTFKMKKKPFEFIKPSEEFSMTRRNFMQAGSVVAGGVLLSPGMATANIFKPSLKPSDRYWYHKPVRIMHTVLREIDARNYDAGKVVDYLKKGGYNTLCVNAGGIVDFFQNPLPAGNINKEMGSQGYFKGDFRCLQ
jgi:hypothetical protein